MLKVRHFLDRNTVLQNETMDEDLEHFKDVTEDDDDDGDQTNAIEIKKAQAVDDTKNSDGNAADSDSSASQDDSTPPDSEGFDSDEANDLLLMGGGQDDIKETRPIADHKKLPSEVTDVRSTFPGGYNLRHREPLYWYLNHSLFIWVIYKLAAWQLCSAFFPGSWGKE